jgi:phosphohistidine phosphatase
MRELILLRHAHAEAAAVGQDDIDRPDRVVCSSARRTRETLEQVLSVIGYVEQRQEPRIYEATPGDLMTVADEHKDLSRVLLVGHNPGLEQLAALLSSGQSGDFRGMPAGGIAVLKLPAEADLEPGVAELAAFWWP